MSRAKMTPSSKRVLRAVQGWRDLTSKQRQCLTDYLVDDAKEQREAARDAPDLDSAGDCLAWARTNVVALELLRAVAAWKP